MGDVGMAGVAIDSVEDMKVVPRLLVTLTRLKTKTCMNTNILNGFSLMSDDD